MNREYKQFVIRGTLFFAVMLILVFVINKVYVDFVLQKQQVLRKEALYLDFIKNLPEKKITYAFFGDSHTRNGINPEYIPNSYNFSGSGENYIKSYHKLKKTLEIDKVKIDNAVLEIDMHTFSTLFTDKDNLFDELYYYSRFVPYSEIAEIRREPVFKVWLEANFPSFGRGEDFINVFVKPDLTEIYRGWTKATGDYSVLDKKKEADISYGLHFVGQQRISDVSFEYFTKTIKLAKENNIKILFIMYPISKEYAQDMAEHGITREDYYAKISERTHDLLGNKYSILDYHDMFFEHPEYFSNADHLNFKGAEILSKKILTDLRRLKN